MRRRHLTATAAVGALCAVVTLLVVVLAPLLPVPHPTRVAGGVQAALHGLTPAGQGGGDSGRQRTLDGLPPLVIGHRGAPQYRPEHTLASYALAIAMGADYIEADLVPTKDRVLVARHESNLAGTTDVARHPEFAKRRRTQVIDGHRVTGWFVEDFTLAELKTLRARERDPVQRPGSAAYDGKFQIPTLQEIINLVRAQRRPVGLYLELKSPEHFAAEHLAPEPLLVAALHANHLDRAGAKLYIESVDAAALRRVHKQLPLPLIQLLSDSDRITPASLAAIHRYAAGIGISRSRLAPVTSTTGTAPTSRASDVVSVAHRAGLLVHVYTFAIEDAAHHLPAVDHRVTDPPRLADALADFRAYFALGVDGVFVDDPDVAVRARDGVVPPRRAAA
ncbi:MAG TPA: glycerophosphodiester phosphodiesterase family protein [Micromonosporaceae bacterium]